jgi:hypothetical protein
MILAKRKPRTSFRLCALMFVALASYIHCAIEFHDHPDQFQDEPLIHDDSDTYAAVVWFEDQCMWIASRFWSNLLTVLIGGHVDTICVMVDSTKLHKVVRKAMGHREINAMCDQSVCQINWFFYYFGAQNTRDIITQLNGAQ